MGGRYIFSAVPIDNAFENSLLLEKVFTSKESAWNIYCIKLNKARTAPLISKRGAALFLRNDVKKETFE
jgi:hypothetical protein